MAIHITASGAQTPVPQTAGILLMNNLTITGTITLSDNNGVFAILTNPVAGGYYVYTGIAGTLTVNPSVACDASISLLSRNTL